MISGIVIEWKKIGRTIGFPTANIALPCHCTDLSAWTYGLSGIIRWETYYGIGVFLQDQELFEAHFFDFDADIYGEMISVSPLFKIRDNQKFSWLEALKSQIQQDQEVMQSYILWERKQRCPRYIVIAAISENRAIGKEGKIPWYIPEDFKHFKATSLGHPIIMGRKTYESVGRPLPGRENIVLTRGDYSWEGITIVHSIKELEFYLSQKWIEKWYICGGSEIYTLFLDLELIDEVILSRIDVIIEWADAFFPEFESDFTLERTDPRIGFTIEYWKRK